MLTCVRALLAVAALAALGTAAPASARAQWGPAQTLSREHFAVGAEIGFTASGATVVSWGWQDGIGNGAKVGASMVSRGPSGAAFGPERELPRHASLPVLYGSTRSLLFSTGRDTLRVQFGDVSGNFGTPRIVARRRDMNRVVLAVNARGEGALAWSEGGLTTKARLYASLRPAGGRFGRPIRLAQEHIRAISVAVGPDGDVLVAWDALGRIRTRFKDRSDRGFGRADTLRSQRTFNAAIRTAVAKSGHAWVAWTAQRLSEGGDPGDAFVQAALRTPRAKRFRRALLLARADGLATPAPVSLAVGADGAATLAWTMFERGATAIQAARVSATGSPDIEAVTRFEAIEPAETAVAAVSPEGEAIVAWTQVFDPANDASRLYASLGPPGGGWGAPELVSEGLQARDPVAAFPPAGGPPVVVFFNRPSGDTFGAVAQLATRVG